ncbi:MAG TPA: GAF domain-containing protein [Cyanobacteria bacterium UBA12227]|nr:GAF domain-containing protein [Cyanobacteria bacterium UBA12227]HBY79752.1 GAF domain-containing protein [Cyanobacteria bacterium UBA11148]
MGQQNLQSQNEHQLLALGRVLETLREEENADVLIETTLHYLHSEFNYRLIWMGLYDRLEHRLFGKGAIAPIDDLTFLKQWFDLEPGDLLEQVVIQQRPVTVPNLQQDSRAGSWRRVATELGIQGTILFPLRCKERCFGVTLLGSPQWGIYQHPAEKAHLSSVLGGLAAALYQIEVNWQRSAIKRPDQPLFQVLYDLMQVPTVTLRLDKLLSMTQKFIAPTRTNLYWYSPERRYFWQRVGSRQTLHSFGDLRSTTAGLMVAEVNDFYQALVEGQLVAIGTGRSLLKAESTERLLARLRTRSLLAAPIQSQGELLGFLSVEDNEPRIWEEGEKKYVSATAQLIGLVVGSEELEANLEKVSKDTYFGAEIAQAIARSSETEVALKNCAELLCKRLEANCFLILQPTPTGQFNLRFGTQPSNRRLPTTPFPPLEPEDQEWLSNSTETLMVENLDESFRLLSWDQGLNQLGVRSLLICRMSQTDGEMGRWGDGENVSLSSPPHPLTPLLLVGYSTARTWNRTERNLVQIVAQQLNLLLALSHYCDRAKLSLFAQQTLQSGLSSLAQASLDSVRFEQTWLDYLINLLECPLAALISWTPQSAWATLETAVVADPRCALPPDLAIPVATSPLIQDALATHQFLSVSVADLPATTRNWLNSPGIGQLLIIALHRGTTPATAILLLADHEERQWPQHLFPTLETLTQQFTWFRYYRYRLSRQVREGEDLQILNWYKHRCLETLHQSVRECVSALLELDAQMPELRGSGEREGEGEKVHFSHFPSLPLSPTPLLHMRRQQLMHQLEATLAMFTPVLKEEQWQLTASVYPLPLANLLKRSLRRVEPLYNQRHVVLNVHNLEKFTIHGDRLKLECIFFELLLTSCLHTQPGTRLHLWCNPINSESTTIAFSSSPRPLLELLISDYTSLEECRQVCTASPAELTISLTMKICQQILRSWGGDLLFYPLDTNRYLMRLLLVMQK